MKEENKQLEGQYDDEEIKAQAKAEYEEDKNQWIIKGFLYICKGKEPTARNRTSEMRGCAAFKPWFPVIFGKFMGWQINLHMHHWQIGYAAISKIVSRRVRILYDALLNAMGDPG